MPSSSLYSAAERLVEQLCQTLMNGDIERVPDFFRLPYPVFHKDEIRVTLTRDDAIEGAKRYREGLSAQGVVRMQCCSAQLVSETEDRCTMRSVWGLMDADGKSFGATEMDLYFFREPSGDVKIAQVSILVTSNPVLRQQMDYPPQAFDA